MQDDIPAQFIKKSQFCNNTRCSLLVVEGAFKKDVLDDFKNELNRCTNWESHDDTDEKSKFWAHCHCKCKYKYDKKKKIECPAEKYPHVLYEIQHWILFAIEKAFPKIFKIIGQNKPNCCYGSCYENNQECNWHCDDDALLDGLNSPIAIYSLNLGNDAIFQSKLKTKYKHSTRGLFDDITLKNGTIIVMVGYNQKIFKHKATQASDCLNLTFGTILDNCHTIECLSHVNKNQSISDFENKENEKNQVKKDATNVGVRVSITANRKM